MKHEFLKEILNAAATAEEIHTIHPYYEVHKVMTKIRSSVPDKYPS